MTTCERVYSLVTYLSSSSRGLDIFMLFVFFFFKIPLAPFQKKGEVRGISFFSNFLSVFLKITYSRRRF